MDGKIPAFKALEDTDAALAAEIARRIGMEMPRECIAGVAFNARLIQTHVDMMRGGQP